MVSEFKFYRVVLPDAVDTTSVDDGFVDGRKVTSFNSLPGLGVASAVVGSGGGGTGYAVNDKITLVQVNDSNLVQAVLNVDAVSTGVVSTVSVDVKGKYLDTAGTALDEVGQDSTTGSGTGAVFDLTLTSETAGFDKVRANLRWEAAVKALQETGSFGNSDVDYTGGDEASAPTQIEFTVAYRSEQVVWMYDLVTDPNGLTVFGPTANLDLVGFPSNVTFTNATEEEVIERAIATALSQDSYTASRQVYDGTRSGLPDPSRSVALFTDRFQTVTVPALGTGGTHALRMVNIEGVGSFTVTQLSV